MVRVGTLFVAFFSAWLGARTVAAQEHTGAQAAARSHTTLVAQGQAQFDELRYEEALQTLSAALVRGRNSPDETATIYRLLAITYLALGRAEEAEGAYRSLLALRPETELGSGLAPRFRSFFSDVRARWESEGRPGRPPLRGVQIRHRSPAQAERGTEVTLDAEIDDPDQRAAEIVLAYRHGSEAIFRRVGATRVDPNATIFTAVIPTEAVAPPLVEYYFEALDREGLPITSRGDVMAPLRIAVPAPESSGSAFGKWWFWASAAAVVGGGVAAAYFLTRSDSEATPSEFGTLIVRVE